MKFYGITSIALLIIPVLGYSQNLPSEDSLSLAKKKSETFVGGYGNFFYQHNANEKKSEINLERAVIFLGHRFNEKFSFFSELEIEDAKVEGGEEGGEIALEQAYIKFILNKNSYITAGLFLPRIGILNENHLPNTFNGNERTQVETYIIPSTWRELGVGFYTQLDAIPMNLSLAVVNGLNSASFEHGTLIRGGRYEGRKASANNLAITGAVQYDIPAKLNVFGINLLDGTIAVQVSAYAGGTVPYSPREADSLRLDSGPFGTPVILGDANVQYRQKALTIKALFTAVSIPDADKINSAHANNTPEGAIGYYAEAGYDFLYSNEKEKNKALVGFVRYEKMNLNSKIPDNGIDDQTLNQSHIIAGISYFPIPNIAIKGDVRLMSTGEENPAITINPSPNAPAYKTDNTFINLGVGFSF